MRLLAIDPSHHQPAYCLMEDGFVIDYGKILLHPIVNWYKKSKRVDYVAIESQYLGVNVRSLMTLSFCAGELAGVAKLAGAEVILISPKQWQAKMLEISPKLRRSHIKSLSKKVASALVKYQINDPDIADAILIAHYAFNKIRRKINEANFNDKQNAK